ncbi:MAG: DNA repair protein RecO [Dehalococcoidia bacterium]|nr:DNA repair protein RecO [Dehalococcoidia bacterium]
MRPEKVYRTQAIVLRHSRLGEADKVLTLYTPYLGKTRAIAKGILKPASRKAGHLEVLSHSALLIARGKNLDIVTQAQTIDSFSLIRDDLGKTFAGFYASEIVDRFTEDGVSSYRIYCLLLDTLRWISDAEESSIPLRYLELHLLEISGYRPELSLCLRCRQPLKESTNLFSPALGGVFCPECGEEGTYYVRISVNALKSMRFLQRSGVEDARRLNVRDALMNEIESILRRYITTVLEREVHSTAFLELARKP